jgi:hypothetical protein
MGAGSYCCSVEAGSFLPVATQLLRAHRAEARRLFAHLVMEDVR